MINIYKRTIGVLLLIMVLLIPFNVSAKDYNVIISFFAEGGVKNTGNIEVYNNLVFENGGTNAEAKYKSTDTIKYLNSLDKKTTFTLKKSGKAQASKKEWYGKKYTDGSKVYFSNSGKYTVSDIIQKLEIDTDYYINSGEAIEVFLYANYSNEKASTNDTSKTHKVTIKYNVNGAVFADKYSKDYTLDNSIVKKNGKANFHTIDYNSSTTTNGLLNYNNSSQLNVKKEGYKVTKDAEWNTKKDGTGKSYSQAKKYKASDFCDASKSDCTVTLYLNWEKDNSVTSISLNKTSGTKYLNSNSSTISLTATVKPSTATDKKVTWSTSDSSVATVDSSGTVTAKGVGAATITAKAGSKTATYSLTVKKKVIIVIGASQVVRMENYATTYATDSYKYAKSNNTLKYVAKGGTGFNYQVGEGWNEVLDFIDNYSKSKKYYDFYIYFPMANNDISKYACSDIKTSNSKIKEYISNYNTKIQDLKKKSYSVKAYVVSCQPVKPTQTSNSAVVKNENSNSCKEKYRSNVKCYTFNKTIKTILKDYSDLKYVETFTKIMEVNEKGTAYSYKVTYNTVDGVHWDKKTTEAYVKYMLESNTNL